MTLGRVRCGLHGDIASIIVDRIREGLVSFSGRVLTGGKGAINGSRKDPGSLTYAERG